MQVLRNQDDSMKKCAVLSHKKSWFILSFRVNSPTYDIHLTETISYRIEATWLFLCTFTGTDDVFKLILRRASKVN